jgi:hypothetical protein
VHVFDYSRNNGETVLETALVYSLVRRSASKKYHIRLASLKLAGEVPSFGETVRAACRRESFSPAFPDSLPI